MAGQALTRADMVAIHLDGHLLVYSAARLLYDVDGRQDSVAFDALFKAVQASDVPAKNGRG